MQSSELKLNPYEMNTYRKEDRSYSPFQDIPYDVIGHIFHTLSHNDLLNFERACLSHLSLTPEAWFTLRKKHGFQGPSWQICQGNHKLNYRLIKALVNYINFSNNKTALTETTLILEKLASFRKIFPPFDALVQLTQLPRDILEVPEILANELKKEELLQAIAHIYQFVKHFCYNISKSSEQEEKEAIEKFYLEHKPKIKELINKGAIYLKDVFISIFRSNYALCFYQKLNKAEELRLSLVVELAYEAHKKQSGVAYEHALYLPYVEDLYCLLHSNLDLPIPSNLAQNQDFQFQFLISQFYAKWKRCEMPHQLQPLVLKIQERMNKIPIQLPLHVLYGLCDVYFRCEKWQEASKVLELIFAQKEFLLEDVFEATKHENDHYRLEIQCARHWYELQDGKKVDNLEHIDAFYDILIKEYDKELTSEKRESKLAKNEIPRLFLAAIKTKMALNNFEGANKHIAIYFGHAPELGDYDIDRRLLQDCVEVKKKINDEIGEAWFNTLLEWRLWRDVNTLDRDSYKVVDVNLDEKSCQSKIYQVPLHFLLELAGAKKKMGKRQEAEIFYDTCLAKYGHCLNFKEKATIASFKYDLQKWKEAAAIYEAIFHKYKNKNTGDYKKKLESIREKMVICYSKLKDLDKVAYFSNEAKQCVDSLDSDSDYADSDSD